MDRRSDGAVGNIEVRIVFLSLNLFFFLIVVKFGAKNQPKPKLSVILPLQSITVVLCLKNCIFLIPIKPGDNEKTIEFPFLLPFYGFPFAYTGFLNGTCHFCRE
jgi:hypothetical protein